MLVLLKIFDWFLTRKKKTNSLSFMYRVVVNGTCNMYGKDPKADPLWVEVQVSSFLARENVASDALFISDLNAWVERYSERVAAFSRWQLLIYVVAVTPSSVAGLLAEDVVDLQAHTQLLNAIFGVYFRELSFYTRNVTSLGWFIQQAWLGFVVVYLKLRGWFWPLN